MGVPKFYRWISERYPKINEIVSDSALLPEFDHLYLDMNGIIHGCTHPSHLDVSDVLSEREMMLGIMHYLDRIITQIVKPKVSVYMAIDGVAPRAKLNQQRSRRFRSAKDLAEATEKASTIGNNHNPSDRGGGDNNSNNSPGVFDSNCITPGTEFLAKVSEMIQYFIRKKIKEDPAWHGLAVIFSGHDIPGEGEHKIMQHIREMRTQPGWSCHERHCIYGQDADLIMLGLVTHEPHFTILREVVNFNFDFGGKNTLKAVKKFTKESDFQLLHLSILREYLQIEFMYQQPQYDLERIIDDFVFMTFLVGNDFLPHMPSLDIEDGAFDLLFSIYKKQRITWGEGEYLTNSGNICDPARLESFLASIGAAETEILEQKEKNAAAYIKKRRRWDRRDGKPEGPSDAEMVAEEQAKQAGYLEMVETMLSKVDVNDPDTFVKGWTPIREAGQKDFKGRYYYEKLKMTPVDKDAHWSLRRSYMEGLMWCLAYYYRGCISWGWFFPYHYGPMLSDLIDVPRMFQEIKFELGEPLSPFQQLMGCLPPASCALVPKLYRWLMASPESPIIHFYPPNFAVDMNGKKNPWEGVNLLPFIDVKLLKETIAAHCPDHKLSSAERLRNAFGKVVCFKYDTSCEDNVVSPNKKIGLLDIDVSHSSMRIIEQNYLESTVSFRPELVPGTQIPYPGFPSLNVIPIASIELVRVGLNCFGSPSKHPNTILHLHQMSELLPIEDLARNVLNKSLFINWPMMHEAKVVAISNEKSEIRIFKGNQKVKNFNTIEADRWLSESQAMQQMYFIGNGVPGSGGVQVGDIKVRLKLLPLQGMRMNRTNGSTKKLFGQSEADVPLQLALLHAPAPDPRFIERGPLSLEDRFPQGCRVVLTKGKYRGCTGTVVGVADINNVGVKVEVMPAEMPFGQAIARSVQETYISSIDAARILKIPSGVVGKVTGKLQFEQGRYDLGLNLKMGDGSCVVGFTRKKKDVSSIKAKGNGKPSAWSAGDSLSVVGSAPLNDDDGRDERLQWEYTPKAIRLVEDYKRKFPLLFAALAKMPNEKKYDANAVFGPNGEAWLPVIREWLDKHDTAKLPRTPVSTESMSYEAVAEVQKAADLRTLAVKKMGYPKESLLKIPGIALYREGSTGATDVLLTVDLNKGEAPELGDRVVNLCVEGIPFGMRGTVVAIHEAATTGSVEVVMDEEFIGGTSLQGACSNFRGKLCLWAHLLRVVPENSQGWVDKLVPKGSGRVAVMNKIRSSIDREVRNSKVGPIRSSSDTHAEAHNPDSKAATPNRRVQDQVTSAQAKVGSQNSLSQHSEISSKTKKATSVQKESKQMPRARSKTPQSKQQEEGASAVRSDANSRQKSTTPPHILSRGRGGRQGTWREARGPDGRGIGFKESKKNGKSGLAKWKTHVATKGAALSSLPSAASSKTLEAKPGVASVSSSQADSAGLKALLGVGPPESPNASQLALCPLEVNGSDATGSLKSILGVRSANQAVSTPQAAVLTVPARPTPATAADKILQMMVSRQQPVAAAGGPIPPPFSQHGPLLPHVRSAFNFTYVEQGSQPSVPPPRSVPPQSYQGVAFHQPMMHQPVFHPQPPIPYATVPGMSSFPPHAFGFTPPLPPPPHPMGGSAAGPGHPYPHGLPSGIVSDISPPNGPPMAIVAGAGHDALKNQNQG